MNFLSWVGWTIGLVSTVGCGGDDGAGVGGNGSTSTSNDMTAGGGSTGGCGSEPTVAVQLALEGGGLVFATVEYSVAGGPRRTAMCQQGFCFIYEGAGQPIQVFAKYESCDEVELSATGAECTDEAPATLAFGFYRNCGGPGGNWPDATSTGGEPSDSTGGDSSGSDSSGSDTDTSSSSGEGSSSGTMGSSSSSGSSTSE